MVATGRDGLDGHGIDRDGSNLDGTNKDGEPRPLRRDALENKQRLLRSARELFAERGFGVTLNDIAHHAGVGVGTAYRRFANKDEVLEAIYLEQIGELDVVLDTALADPDPWHGLVYYLETAMALQLRDKGLAQILSGTRVSAEQHDYSRDVLAPKVNAIAERARSAGAMRADATGTDLILLQVGLNAIMNISRDTHPDLYRRYLQLALDGLRAGAGTSLPVPALTTEQTHAVMGPTAGPSTASRGHDDPVPGGAGSR